MTVVDSPDNAQLDGINGAFLIEHGLRALVIATCTEAMLTNPGLFQTYLRTLKAKLVKKKIVPWGLMVEEEWFDRVNNPASIKKWACFAGMTMWQRKDFLFPRLKTLIRLARTMFPNVPIVQVETKWNERRASGASLWYPDYGADVIGVDAYLRTDGWAYLKTPPLDASGGPAMREKFLKEVGYFVKGSPDKRITGAVALKKPIMLVGQAFRDHSGAWRTLPTTQQLHWFYALAQAVPAVTSLAWFCWQSTPGLTDGLSLLPKHAAAVQRWYRSMVAAS